MTPPRLTLVVPPEGEGRTVDALLRKALLLAGSQVRRAKTLPDGILLDGVPVFVNVRARAGQTLSVRLDGGAAPSDILPVEGPVDVVYEDGHILVINKAAGVAVHPGPGHYDDTLGNFLAWKYRDEPNYVYRPAHRLDKGTSGLLVVARHAHAQERLRLQLHTGAFQRTYLAVCQGVPEPRTGVVDAPVGRADGSLLRREVRPDGLPARTRYEVLREVGGRALLRLALESGRTHQIRVHMAHIGCPLTGDFLYGTEAPEVIGRAALHSWQLALGHPVTGQALRFAVALPEDILRLLRDSIEGPQTES